MAKSYRYTSLRPFLKDGVLGTFTRTNAHLLAPLIDFLLRSDYCALQTSLLFTPDPDAY